VPCPLCGGTLKCFGTRLRKCVLRNGEKIVLSLRRLRCSNPACHRIHHELPAFLLPYKRHECASIERVCTSQGKARDVAVEDSTIGRWKRWLEGLASYWEGCLRTISVRMGFQSGTKPEASSASPLQRLFQHLGHQPGWLAVIVRTLVNAGLWVQTRSALVAGTS